MAELDYAGLTTGLVQQLKDTDGLDGVHVTAEPDPPTTEQCPAVLVHLTRASRTPARLVAGLTTGAPDDVVARFQLGCFVFSAQGAADAARQRDELLTIVVDAVRADRSIGGRVDWCEAGDVDFSYQPGGSHGSFYAVAILTVLAHARA